MDIVRPITFPKKSVTITEKLNDIKDRMCRWGYCQYGEDRIAAEHKARSHTSEPDYPAVCRDCPLNEI